MHRKLKLCLGTTGLAVALAMASAPALAAGQYGDSHCFKKVAGSETYPEDNYANGKEQDESTVAALEELNERHWQLRKTEMPYKQAQRYLDSAGEPDWWSARSIIEIERERQFNNSRTGAKIIYVTPAMKRLARERSEIRNIKQKPCNPNITYLGSR